MGNKIVCKEDKKESEENFYGPQFKIEGRLVMNTTKPLWHSHPLLKLAIFAIAPFFDPSTPHFQRRPTCWVSFNTVKLLAIMLVI